MHHHCYHLISDVMQNDALVAQMEGMSHEEQQQFLAQQVTEQVSLPDVPPYHIKIHSLSCCILRSAQSLELHTNSSSLQTCSRAPEDAGVKECA